MKNYQTPRSLSETIFTTGSPMVEPHKFMGAGWWIASAALWAGFFGLLYWGFNLWQ